MEYKFIKENKRKDTSRCSCPEHNAPSFLYIPPGQLYKHVCPWCKHETFLKSMEFK